jgi:hypothetical protein
VCNEWSIKYMRDIIGWLRGATHMCFTRQRGLQVIKIESIL